MTLAFPVIFMNILIIMMFFNVDKLNVVYIKYLPYLIYFMSIYSILRELPVIIRYYYPQFMYNYSLPSQISDIIISSTILVLVVMLYSINIIIIGVSKHNEELIKKYSNNT